MSMLYTEELLEHYRNPQNFREMSGHTGSITLQNPLCGDVITMFVRIEKGVVEDASFQGQGCAISTASASIFTEYLKKKRLSQLRNFDKKSMMKVVGIEVSPGRIKCLLLPLEALQRIIANKK